ncbi:MAG: thermonuclease family protein [Psychrilyobacter sp.]|uniref:thermonuclease family protein n=1 Tax=Psychrilyobacter sp. TaxID=2586924 RepID=UPI003C711188
MKKILLIFLLLGTLVFGEILVGKVIKVYDGDTITILVDGKKEKIRFFGIDAPEMKQNYGVESRNFVRSKIMGKKVKVKIVNTDKYGRKVGKIYYSNNRYLNLECVKTGNAWWYEYYAKKEYDLKLAQEQARRSRKGLWREKNPVNPYKWRKNKK